MQKEFLKAKCSQNPEISKGIYSDLSVLMEETEGRMGKETWLTTRDVAVPLESFSMIAVKKILSVSDMACLCCQDF